MAEITTLLRDLKQAFGDLAGLDLSAADAGAPFLELGLDSLCLTQAAAIIKNRFGAKVTFRQLNEDLASFEALAAYLLPKLPQAAPPPVAVPAPVATPQQPAVTVAAETRQIEHAALPPQNGNRPAGASTLEMVIKDQLKVMELQLALLRGGRLDNAVAATQAAPAEQAPPQHAADSTAVTAAVSAPSVQHGPFKPLDKQQAKDLAAQQQAHLDWLIPRYVARTPKSKEYTERYRRSFADPRAVAGFKQNWKEMVYPVVSTRSSGAHLWDIDGNKWVDVTMGFGVALLGHSPAFINEALKQQLDLGVEIGPQSPVAGEVAELICEFTGMDRVTFCNTGSEAVMAALRICRTVTARTKIVLFAGAYHGTFDEVLVKGTTVNGEPRTVPLAPGVAPNLISEVVVLDYGTAASLEWIRAHAGELAAVLVEPVQSRHPDLQPVEFLREVRRITLEAETPLIMDEVITGFRCHPGGAQALFGIQADLATYGKIIGGGMPFGFIAGKSWLMDAFDGGQWQYGDDSIPPSGVTFFAGTFVRHPLAMAAARAMLHHLKEHGPALQSGLAERTNRLTGRLNQYFQQHKVPMRLEHFTSVWYPHFDSEVKYGSLLYFHLREKGLHIWEGRPCFLSTAHTDGDEEFIERAFKLSIAEMQLGGFIGGTSAPEIREEARALRGEAGESIVPVTANRFPPADGQREMWLGAQMSPDAAGPHHACTAIDFDGDLDVEVLRQAIQKVVERHEGLRCTFSPDGSEVICHPMLELDVPVLDLSGLEQAARDARVEAIMHEEAGRLFDLTAGPLIAFQILKLSEKKHRLIFTAQMIVCDGWSHYVVFEELSAIYSALVEGRQPALNPPVQMREYALWQQRTSSSDEARRCEAFWLSSFETIPEPIQLPVFASRPPFRTSDGERRELTLEPEFYQELKRVAKELKNSSFALLLATFQTWLFRLSGSSDLVVGVPFAGQGALGHESLVGQCANTLPLRAQISSDELFISLAQRTWELLVDAQENWNYTFGRLVQKLNLPPDPSRTPLVSFLFNIDPAMNRVRFSRLAHRFVAGPRRYFQYDLGFNLVEDSGALRLECDYNPNLFKGDCVQLWLGHFKTLLQGLISDPKQPLGTIPMLDETDSRRASPRNNLVRTFSNTATLHKLVSEQALRTPDAVAVEYEGQRLTYSGLETRANQLANHLRVLGVGPEILVGLYLKRSIDLVVGALGVLKAGGAYVPIDADMPQERIGAILQDTAVPVLLTHTTLLSDLPETTALLICLDEDGSLMAQESTAPPEDSATSENLAYVIYTSGSTGKPKGVEIPHRAVVNFLESMRDEPGLKADDVMLALTTMSFDISVLELFGPLIAGAKVVIGTRDVLMDPERLSLMMNRCGVTVMQATPTTYRLLLNGGWRGTPNLKVLCGGEALASDLAERLLRCGSSLWNMYGPTETTVWSAICEIKPGEPVYLGHPIANTDLYIVDDQLQLVPAGVPGELLIGGEGLARGYRNLPAATAESFICDPFSSDPNARVYRTRDFVRYHADGGIEFIGRQDQQIKLRGYRIELGEIESVLLSHPNVREAVVLLREDPSSEPRLAAYVVPGEPLAKTLGESSESALLSDLRQMIQRKLPDYMVPSAFVLMEALPRTSEGKTDRRSLPALTKECFDGSAEYLAPRNEFETKLVRIWSEVLNVGKVGIRDNFFRLGGHSLLAASMFVNIEREFNRKLPLATLFRAPTVEQLADALSTSIGEFSSDWASLVPIQPKGSRRPLFLVHGAGGNVLLYRCLAEHLAPEYPLYGLQSRGLDGKHPPLATIEEMAVEYLREIRTVQPKGPYYLGGYCLGGTVAYEMAQILQREGEEVALVAMLDTYNFSLALKPKFLSYLAQRLRFHVGNFVRLRPGEMMTYIREKLRVMRDGELANMMSSMPGSTSEEGVSRALAGVEASVQAVNDYAADHYIPKPYSGRLTLLKPATNYKFYPDAKMGWGDLALGGLDIVELAMNPHAMLVEPFVGILASELKARLESPAPTQGPSGEFGTLELVGKSAL